MRRLLAFLLIAFSGNFIVSLRAQDATVPPPAVERAVADDELAETEQYDKLARYWLKPDSYAYAGFTFRRACSPAGGCKLEIARGGKKIQTLVASDAKTLSYGFFPFVRAGLGEKQLVVQIDTGGAHCCERYYIYALEPRLLLLYDGGRFDYEEIGNYLEPVDVDGDGTYEFVVDVMAFDYQLGSHALSPFPPAVFAYNAKLKSYVLANRKFAAYVRARLAADKQYKAVSAMSPEDQNTLTARFLAAVKLLYAVYAGDAKDGWHEYETEYHGADKAELRASIKKILADDVTYRALYPARK